MQLNSIKSNIIWLVFDKFLILILQFVIGVKIANHFGAYVYGKYTYALSIIAFSPILLELINARIIKKNYSENDYSLIISTVSVFKIVITFFIALISLSLIPVFKLDRDSSLLLILLAIDNIFLMSSFGIENYFEFNLQSKYTVIANNLIKLLSYSLQFIVILFDQSIFFIVIVRISGNFLRAGLIYTFYVKKYKTKIAIRLDLKLLKKMMLESRYLWLSTISYIIYTQADKIMIGNMLGKEELGIYFIAVQLMNVMQIFIAPFSNSVFPKLLEAFNENNELYEKTYMKYTSIITWFYILIIPLSIVVVRFSFKFVFNEEYYDAIYVFYLMTITVLFRGHVAFRSSYFTIISKTNILLFGTVFGAIFNILMNLVLIPITGIKGAAISTTISIFISSIIVCLFFPEGRRQIYLNILSINPRWTIKKIC